MWLENTEMWKTTAAKSGQGKFSSAYAQSALCRIKYKLKNKYRRRRKKKEHNTKGEVGGTRRTSGRYSGRGYSVRNKSPSRKLRVYQSTSAPRPAPRHSIKARTMRASEGSTSTGMGWPHSPWTDLETVAVWMCVGAQYYYRYMIPNWATVNVMYRSTVSQVEL